MVLAWRHSWWYTHIMSDLSLWSVSHYWWMWTWCWEYHKTILNGLLVPEVHLCMTYHLIAEKKVTQRQEGWFGLEFQGMQSNWSDLSINFASPSAHHSGGTGNEWVKVIASRSVWAREDNSTLLQMKLCSHVYTLLDPTQRHLNYILQMWACIPKVVVARKSF